MREIRAFIWNLNLVDIPCSVNKFSFYRGDGRPVSRLDRFILSDSQIDRWGIFSQFIGKRDISDHCPIWIGVLNLSG